MPGKVRHKVLGIGLLLTGTNSPPVNAGSAAKGMVLFAGGNSDITVECSPDGGSTWHDLYHQDGTQVFENTPIGPGGDRTIPIRVLPKDLRVSIGAPAAMADISFDTIRNIA